MIRIISDSSTQYTIAEGRAKNIDIAPLSVTINNITYKENEEINTEKFIDIINEGYLPKSSQPAIGEVVDLYNKYKGDEIINITMADGLSGTYNSACAAKEMAEEPENIEVINSTTLCGPQRYLVDLAQKLVELKKSKEEIVKEINNLKETAVSYLLPNDFDYLVRGGRLSSLAGKIGSIIKIVPIIKTTKDGTRLDKFSIKKTFPKAVEKICDDMIEYGVNKDYIIFVSHACKEELAVKAKAIIEESIQGIEIIVRKLGPAFTTQGGPGCVSIQFIKKHPLLD